jgi:hypothetical protein
MTFQKIASELAKREGRKSQARVGDIRELLSQLVKWEAEIDGETDGPIAALDLMAIASRQKRQAREAKKAAKAKAQQTAGG